MFGGSRRFVTGLDIGTESVKAVRLMHAGDEVKLVGIAFGEISRPGADGEAVADEARVNTIRDVLTASGTDVSRGGQVVTALDGPSVSIKHVTFPKMPGPSLAESIGWEAKKHVPFGTEEFVMDFQSLPRTDAESDDEMHVLLAAVEKRHIDAHVALVGEAGVEPHTIDLVPLALLNEVEEEGLLNGGAVAAVEMGHGTLNVSIYRTGGLLLVRSVRMPPGATELGDGSAAGVEESPEARRQWQTFIQKEVQRSLAFYNSETGRRGIDAIYLSGGRSLAPGIADEFTKAFKVPAALLNPLTSIACDGINVDEMKPQGPQFALAASLARRK